MDISSEALKKDESKAGINLHQNKCRNMMLQLGIVHVFIVFTHFNIPMQDGDLRKYISPTRSKKKKEYFLAANFNKHFMNYQGYFSA